jgi:hypothetical protein
MSRRWMVLGAALVVAACGDPGADADRGYVKPPLEKPGLVVEGEDVSPMTELGETNRPRPRDPREAAPES